MLLVYFLLSLWLYPPPSQITSTNELVQAMQSRYAGKWAKTITFTQYNTHYAADTVKDHSTWYEAIAYPKDFRIDFGLPKEGNAVIFSRDSVFSFKAGELKSQKPQVNNLMLLAGGIYFYSLSEAIQRLGDAGYNVSLFHADTWEGKSVYVVGAAKGDLQKPQFWIDQKNLYLVRTINTTPDGGWQDAQFRKHIKTGGGWTETEVLFLKDGKKQQLEEYKDIRANVTLSADIFDAHHFGKVHWMK